MRARRRKEKSKTKNRRLKTGEKREKKIWSIEVPTMMMGERKKEEGE